MMEVFECTAKEIDVVDEFDGNEIWVEAVACIIVSCDVRREAVDRIVITETLPFEECSEIHFRAGNIRAVIDALEEMADWLEESPEEVGL